MLRAASNANAPSALFNPGASGFSVTSSTVLTNVPGMVAALLPGTYELRLSLHISTNAVAAGYKWGWTSTCTFGTSHAMGGIAVIGGGPALFNFDPSTGTGNTQSAVTASDDVVTAVGTFTVTVAGNLQLQFAQGTSNATASTLLNGSTMTLTKVA